MRNIGVILAGGIGSRMRLDIPKQFLKVAGKPIVEHTLEAFDSNDNIDEIIILITPGYIDSIEPIANKFTKVTAILEGGDTRNETSKIAINHIGEEANIVFHDAVRPFVSHKIINDCIDALREYQAVDVAIPSADTIIRVEDRVIEDIPDRSKLMRGQTPQAFKWSIIKEAYDIAASDPDFKATDDCGVVLKYLPKVPIYVVDGGESNMKVTHPLDASIADKIFQLNSSEIKRLTEGERGVAMSGKVVIVFGGSYGIGGEICEMAKQLGALVYSFSRSKTSTDITNVKEVKRVFKEVYDKEGRIDFVVNTAGQLSIGDLDTVSDDEVAHLINVNYQAPVMIAKYALPYLQETSGQLLLFTSSSYTRGRASYSLYSSSKAAIVNLTQALGEEWVDKGVRINCINPERTATPMRKKAFGEEDPAKLLTARDVAEVSIDSLISDTTGQIFEVRVR